MRLAFWSSANCSCAWLSIVEVRAGLKIVGESGVVMPSWTDAMMTVGIFAWSSVSRAAKVALLHPPPISANTLSSDTSFFTAPIAAAGSQRSSSRTSTSLRPLMPPLALTSSNTASMPFIGSLP